MDAGARLTSVLPCGRRSRVVLTPRRWRQARDDAMHHTGDGDNKARSPGRVRRKPLKPSRAGMPGDPGATVVANSCAFYTLRTRLRVQRAPGIPHALLGRKMQQQLGRIAPRDGGGATCRHYERSEASRSRFFIASWIASLPAMMISGIGAPTFSSPCAPGPPSDVTFSRSYALSSALGDERGVLRRCLSGSASAHPSGLSRCRFSPHAPLP